MIAAYNAGPAPVAEWKPAASTSGDPLLYIESIPYWETRGYVPIVLRNYWIYEEGAAKAAAEPGRAGAGHVAALPGHARSERGAAQGRRDEAGLY